MADKQFQLIYALKNDVPVSILDVESGLKCGCVCPMCGEALVAKKGPKNMHHFSHSSGGDCAGGYQTSLHLAAKDILSKAQIMVIPPVYTRTIGGFGKRLVSKEKTITIDRVELEKKLDNIIPDIVVYTGGKRLLVEIYVTHAIDDEKLGKIKRADISTIEIDLHTKRGAIAYEELREILLFGTREKEWKYNAYENDISQLVRKYADVRKANGANIEYIFGSKECPIPRALRKVCNYYGVEYIHGCEACKYFWGIIDDQNGYDNLQILCTQRNRIGTLDDLISFRDNIPL